MIGRGGNGARCSGASKIRQLARDLANDRPIPLQRLDEAARFRFTVLAARAWANLGKEPQRGFEPNDDDTGGYGIQADIAGSSMVLGVPCRHLMIDTLRDIGIGGKSSLPLGPELAALMNNIDAIIVVHSVARIVPESGDWTQKFDVWGYWPMTFANHPIQKNRARFFDFHLPEVLLLNNISASLVLRHNRERYWLTLPV